MVLMCFYTYILIILGTQILRMMRLGINNPFCWYWAWFVVWLTTGDVHSMTSTLEGARTRSTTSAIGRGTDCYRAVISQCDVFRRRMYLSIQCWKQVDAHIVILYHNTAYIANNMYTSNIIQCWIFFMVKTYIYIYIYIHTCSLQRRWPLRLGSVMKRFQWLTLGHVKSVVLAGGEDSWNLNTKDDLKKYTWNIRPSARVEAIYTEQGLRWWATLLRGWCQQNRGWSTSSPPGFINSSAEIKDQRASVGIDAGLHWSSWPLQWQGETRSNWIHDTRHTLNIWCHCLGTPVMGHDGTTGPLSPGQNGAQNWLESFRDVIAFRKATR